MAAAGEEIVVLADHTKIGQETMAQTVPSDQIDHLVTSEKVLQDALEQFRSNGTEVRVVRDGSFGIG